MPALSMGCGREIFCAVLYTLPKITYNTLQEVIFLEQRHFPSIGLDVSLLGFGCMRFPTRKTDGKIALRASKQLLEQALAAGVNYFDTAWGYHDGASEEFVGSVLSRHPRADYFLADKLPIWLVNSLEEAEATFEEQLRRCRTDYFDFYLIHAMDDERFPKMEALGIYDLLARKKAEGKIRHLGFSYHDSPALLSEILKAHPWDFVQIQLNYLDWTLQSAKEQYELITGHGLPVVVMEPVRGGALATLSDKAADILRAAAPHRSIASWAIRYVASLPGVMCVLSGMSSEAQLADNLATMEPFSPLTGEEHATVQAALTAYLTAGTVPCTGCRYCMDCPAGVDIPKSFAMYNQYKLDGRVGHLLNSHGYMGEAHQPHQCVRCGKCLPLCPQRIQIPDVLAQVASAVHGAKEPK